MYYIHTNIYHDLYEEFKYMTPPLVSPRLHHPSTLFPADPGGHLWTAASDSGAGAGGQPGVADRPDRGQRNQQLLQEEVAGSHPH